MRSRHEFTGDKGSDGMCVDCSSLTVIYQVLKGSETDFYDDLSSMIRPQRTYIDNSSKWLLENGGRVQML